MQKIKIKKKVIKTDDCSQSYYYVPALSLKNSSNKVKLLVPHPNGNDIMEFSSLTDAAAAVRKAGFEYLLPDGEVIKEDLQIAQAQLPQNDLENILFNKFKSKVNDINSSIAASSITALAYLNNKDTIDIFIDKLGEDNEKIRTAAIDAIVNNQNFVLDKLIDALSNKNWVARNSAITCLVKISEYINTEPEKIIIPIINRIDDENSIVQANAILAAGKIYRTIINRNDKENFNNNY